MIQKVMSKSIIPKQSFRIALQESSRKLKNLAGSSLVDNLAEIVGSKKMYDRAISINMGDNSVQVEIKVILAYGTHIPEIAEAIQLAVIGEITKITGMQVNKVNVVIIDLEEEQDQSDAE